MVGMQPQSRTIDIRSDLRTWLQTNGIESAYAKLNDDREHIYMFRSWPQLLAWLSTSAPDAAPAVFTVTPTELAQAHEYAVADRFSTVYQPSPVQIPTHARGAHGIEQDMLPPVGSGHHWTQAPSHTGSAQYGIFVNQIQPPSAPTLPLTYGNPAQPSLIMSQGGLNLGMHIQPAPSSFLVPTAREDTRYAGLPAVSDRVRGHPFALEQNQRATGPLPSGPTGLTPLPGMNFDIDPRTYTDESDSTKAMGGISSWRYNEVEKPAINSGQPFLQVNMNPTMSAMGAARPSQIFVRTGGGGVYDDRLMDNTATTDYRNDPARPKKTRKQAHQSNMGRNNAAHGLPYARPPVFKKGFEYDSATARRDAGPAYPGSPMASPFLVERGYTDIEWVLIDDLLMEGTRTKLADGRTVVIVSIEGPDAATKKWKYRVREVVKPSHPTAADLSDNRWT